MHMFHWNVTKTNSCSHIYVSLTFVYAYVCVGQVSRLYLLHYKHGIFLLHAAGTSGHRMACSDQRLLPNDLHGLAQHLCLATPDRYFLRGTVGKRWKNTVQSEN